MTVGDWQHVRWLAGHLVRDDADQLVIAPHALAGVERTIHAGLDDPSAADQLIEEILRLASGALNEGGQVELARALVSMVLVHPVGRAQLEKSRIDKGWLRFVDDPGARAPVHDGPTPEGSVPLSSFVSKHKKRYE